MKNKLLEVGKHSLIYGVSSAFQGIVGLLFLPLLTSYFSTDEFGVYSLLLLLSTLSSALFFFGASSIINRYFFESDTVEHRKGIVTTTFTIAMIGAVVQVMLAVGLSSQLSRFIIGDNSYSNHMLLILLSGSVGMIVNYNLVILRIEKKSTYFVLNSIVSNLVNIIVTYVLLEYFGYGLYAPIIGLLTANTIAMCLSYPVIHKYLWARIDRKALKEFVFFGFSTTITGFSYYFLDWIDRYFIKEYASISDVGIYSLGYRIGMVIHIIVIIPFSMIWSTLRMQYAKADDNRKFVARVISYFSIVGITIVFFTLLFSKELLYIFSRNDDYIQAYTIIPVIMLGHLTYGYINIVDYGIYLSKKLYFYYAVLFSAALFNAVLNFFFVPLYGYIAAAYITLGTYFLCTLTIFLISNRFYKIDIELRSVLPYFGVLTLIVINAKISQWSILLKALIFIITLISVFVLWLSKNERIVIKKYILQKRICL